MVAMPGRELRIQTPRVFIPLLAPTMPDGRLVRYRGAYGGRGGAKSWAFAEMLLERCLMARTNAVCVREVQVSLKQSVRRLLVNTIERLGVSKSFRVLNTHIECPYGGTIIFQGMSDVTSDSIKSLEGFDIAWVEEAQSLSERSLGLLRPTIRKPGSEIWASWNPRRIDDPIDVFFRGAEAPPDSVVVSCNYYDNPFFPDVLHREMEYDKRRDFETYEHVWLGGYEKHSEARVFKNWVPETFDTPPNVVSFYYGADWGFSLDPSVLVRCYIDGRRLFIDHEAYKIGCEINDTPDMFDRLVCQCEPPRPCRNPTEHGVARRWTVTADSARPETISYLQKHGYPRMRAAVKGANSVKEGVIFLQSFDIVVHDRCTHTIDELRRYSYKVDPLTNNPTPILQDKKNHVIDSLRYAVEELRAPKKLTKATWGS